MIMAQITIKIDANNRFEAGDILIENIKENSDLTVLSVIYND